MLDGREDEGKRRGTPLILTIERADFTDLANNKGVRWNDKERRKMVITLPHCPIRKHQGPQRLEMYETPLSVESTRGIRIGNKTLSGTFQDPQGRKHLFQSNSMGARNETLLKRSRQRHAYERGGRNELGNPHL